MNTGFSGVKKLRSFMVLVLSILIHCKLGIVHVFIILCTYLYFCVRASWKISCIATAK